MSKVFTNDMVSHVWANQSRSEGRSHNGQFYFEGPTLFSYGRHYAAGFVLHFEDGGCVHMINADSNSTTTARHVSRARMAAPGRALQVPGLTDWAATLAAATTRYDWGKAEAEEAAGGRAAWLPCGHVLKSKKERRAYLPELRARFNRYPFPGEEAAAAMFRALGESNPDKAAAVQARKAAMRAADRAAEKEKEERATLARAARYTASRTPRDIARAISEVSGSYAGSDFARDRLAAWGREVNRESKEAKARGWTLMAATLRGHYRAVRAAVRDAESRNAAAYRNRNRRRSIQRFRDACYNVAKEGQTTEGNAGRVALHWGRAFSELAAACADLSRHLHLNESTLARLAEIQEEARGKAATYEEEAGRIRFAEEEEARADWLAGGQTGRRLSDPRGGAMLRAAKVERDESGAIVAGDLQTSHGAAVPLAHALRVFRFLKLCRANGKAWATNGRALRVGHFRVDSVAPSGDFVAGCHRINWPEVERLAASLGVDSLAPEDTTAES